MSNKGQQNPFIKMEILCMFLLLYTILLKFYKSIVRNVLSVTKKEAIQMSKKELLQSGINQVFYEEERSPPLSEALKNLTATQACWQPKGNAANTIWENVNHLLIFKERLLSRLHKDDTFVAPQNNDEEAWQETVKRTLHVYDALQSSLVSRH